MSPPSKLRKISSFTAVFDQVEVPTLPNDLLLLIFGKLTTAEREPLSTSCKRFREIDFDLGRKTYDEINVEWTSNVLTTAVTRNSNVSICGHFTVQDQLIYSMRMLRKAKIKMLKIKLSRLIRDQSKFDYIQWLFINTRFKVIHAVLNCSEDFTETFMQTLMAIPNLKKVKLHLTMHSTGPFHDVIRTQTALKTLPRMREIKLNYERPFFDSGNNHQGPIINFAVLLHLLNMTIDTVINCTKIEISGQEILDIFEIFCNAGKRRKYIKFDVPIFSSEALFAMPITAYKKCLSRKHGKRCILDRAHNVILSETHPSSRHRDNFGFSRIQIWKTVKK